MIAVRVYLLTREGGGSCNGCTWRRTYHGDRVDRVQDGKQQDVVLRKVPIGIICKLCIMWFVFSNSCIKKTNVCFFIMWTACLKQIIKIMFLTCIVCVYVAWQCLAGGYLWSFGDYICFPLTSIFTLRVKCSLYHQLTFSWILHHLYYSWNHLLPIHHLLHPLRLLCLLHQTNSVNKYSKQNCFH